MTDRRRVRQESACLGPRSLALLAVGIVFAPSMAGCVMQDRTLAFSFPYPLTGGTWTINAERSGGTETIKAELKAAHERVLDGVMREVPVLRLEHLDGKLKGLFLVHYLTPDGVSGWRSNAQVRTQDALLGEAVYEADQVFFEPNAVSSVQPWWVFLGPGLWGNELRLGEVVEIRLTTLSLRNATGSFKLAGVEKGCAIIDIEIDRNPMARARYCGDIFPERIEVSLITQNLGGVMYRIEPTVYTLRRQEGPRSPLPLSPQVQPKPVGPVQGVPMDSSELPFTLEEAHAALKTDPRTQGWLSTHPDAVALTGRFLRIRCTPPSFDELCDATFQGIHEQQFEWVLTWNATNGDWMSVRLVKALADIETPPRVVSVQEGTGEGREAAQFTAYALKDALTLRDLFQDETFYLHTVTYNLSSDYPLWTFLARKDPSQSPEPTGGFVVDLSFSVRMDTGLAYDGFVTPEARQ